MPTDGSTETNGAGATGSDTPSAPNVSDVTQQTQGHTTTNVTNDDAASRPAATRSDDTRGAGYDFSKLETRMDAMPESIANAVKEVLSSIPAPSAQASSATPDNSTTNAGNGQNGNSATGNGGETAVTASRTERFSSWWFGK